VTIWLPTVEGPTDLPDLRDWFLTHWRPGTAVYEGFPDSGWVRRTLQSAALWWVEPDTCEVLAASAPSIPADRTLDLHDLPTPSGLAIFASDLEGIDSDPDWDVLAGKVRVSGIMWGPITLGISDTQTYSAISIATFSRSIFRHGLDQSMEDMIRARPHLAALIEGNASKWPKTGDLFSYLGRSDWLPGYGPDDLLPGDNSLNEQTKASKAEDRRLVAALWALTRITVAEVSTPKIPRPTVRRAQRKGLDPKVRVLSLGGERVTRAAHVGVSEREWKHSWIVSPHWRWQPYGPGRTLRRLRLIEAYRKGDPNLPLLGSDRVWVVKPPRL
jgi:hypothetical protein